MSGTATKLHNQKWSVLIVLDKFMITRKILSLKENQFFVNMHVMA